MKRIIYTLLFSIVAISIVSAQYSKLTINLASKPSNNDGIIDSMDPWIVADWITVAKGKVTNVGDMSAKFQLKYDKVNLYFATIVQDDDRFIGNPTSYQNDCVEFFISMDTTAWANAGAYHPDLSTKQMRLQAYNIIDGLPECGQTAPSSGVYSCVDNGSNYVQEWTMPWSDLSDNMNPAWDQKQFRFDVIVSNATAYGARTQQMFWDNISDDQWRYTFRMGVVTLNTPIQNIKVFNVDISSDKMITCGDSVKLNSTVNYNGSSILTYNWSPADGLNAINIPNPIAFTKTNKKYTLTVTSTDFGAVKDSISITVNPLTVNCGTDQSIICGGNVQLAAPVTNYSGSGVLTYLWSPTTGLSSANVAQPQVEVITNTSYTLEVTSPNGCKAKDNILITVNPLTVNCGTDQSIICGGNVQLNTPVTNYSGSGILKYTWMPTTGLSSASVPQPTAEVITNTIYTLEVTTPNGCKANDNVLISVNPLTLNCGKDLSITCGGNIQLNKPVTNYTGSDFLTYSWMPITGLSSSNIAQPVSDAIINTTYTLKVTTANGCNASDNIAISVNPLTVTARNIIFSCGNTSQLNVTTNYTGTGGLSYNWTPSVGLSSTTISNPIADLTVNEKYNVEVYTPNGCSANDDMNVTPSVISYNPEICMVTVDVNEKNVVVINRVLNDAIDSFFIYRESEISNKYDLIGKLPSSWNGIFVDVESNATVQSNKYSVVVKDICGLLTDFSKAHKTVHLMISQGIGNNWNLSWDPYLGFPVSNYKIYRGTSPSNMSQIASISGINNTYIDLTSQNVYYQLEVFLPETCNNQFTSLRSNIVSNFEAPIGIRNLTKDQAFIYPNPAKDKLTVSTGYSKNAIIVFYNSQGKQVLNSPIIEEIDISSLSKGLYVVRLLDSGKVFVNKLVKE